MASTGPRRTIHLCSSDDAANAFILSAASHVDTSVTTFDSIQGIEVGANAAIESLPADFQFDTLLVLGKGINKTYETWGRALTDFTGKTRPNNDARLLPLFEKFGNDQAPALRARLAMLSNDVPERMRQMDDPLYTRGIVPEDASKDRVQDALDRLDRAKTSDERDRVYFEAAMAASRKDYERARQLADKIEESELRKQMYAYLTFDAMQQAINDKKPDDALRFARSQELTNVQRAWGLTEVGRLLAKTEPDRAAEMLDLASAEARRIDQSSPDRVRALVAIVTQFQKVDSARAWEMMSEVIKAANALSGFSGEDGEMTVMVKFKNSGAMTQNMNVESFDLTGLFTALAEEDFNRAADLPKGFTGESPRAVAMLAVARTVLIKKK